MPSPHDHPIEGDAAMVAAMGQVGTKADGLTPTDLPVPRRPNQKIRCIYCLRSSFRAFFIYRGSTLEEAEAPTREMGEGKSRRYYRLSSCKILHASWNGRAFRYTNWCWWWLQRRVNTLCAKGATCMRHSCFFPAFKRCTLKKCRLASKQRGTLPVLDTICFTIFPLC